MAIEMAMEVEMVMLRLVGDDGIMMVMVTVAVTVTVMVMVME